MKKYILFVFVSLLIVFPVKAEEILVTSSSSDNISIVSSTVNTTISVEEIVFEVKTDRELVEEPTIRVGLLKTFDVIKFKSEIDYEIYGGDEFIVLLPAGEIAKISYKKGLYYLTSESLALESKIYWRLKPTDPEGVFEIPGCKRTISGRKSVFCSYRGIFEYRYAPKSKMPYLINELPLEQYIKGITETDNNSAEGYVKAVLVAARSYAYKNISFDPPTEKRMFDVYATTQDQLYLGYISETSMPRVAQFAQETVGEMVTYKNNVVTTPYFSRSNGKTKTWKNAKRIADRPWMVSVECKYDKKMKQWGHGYGMSTRDALMRATKDKWGYIQLLGHYYSGTEVEKIY